MSLDDAFKKVEQIQKLADIVKPAEQNIEIKEQNEPQISSEINEYIQKHQPTQQDRIIALKLMMERPVEDNGEMIIIPAPLKKSVCTKIEDLVKEYETKYRKDITTIAKRMNKEGNTVIEAYFQETTELKVLSSGFYYLEAPEKNQLPALALGNNVFVDARSENASFVGTISNPMRLVTMHGYIELTVTNPNPLFIVTSNGKIEVDGVDVKNQSIEKIEEKICYYNRGKGHLILLRAEGPESYVKIRYTLER